MTILVAGSQGEWGLFENTLDPLGADTKRQGSVLLISGQQMFKEFTGSTDMWFHVRMAAHRDGANTPGIDTIRIRDAANNVLAGITTDGQAGSAGPSATWDWRFLYATNGAGSTSTAGSEFFRSTPFIFLDFDFHIQISTTTNPNDTMQIDFYLNEQLRFTRTISDVSGWEVPTNLILTATQSGGADLNTETYYQDVIVTDGIPTVGMELGILLPNAVGFHSDFGNDYTAIDDVGYDPTDLISTDAVPEKESWTFAAPGFSPGNKVIYGLLNDSIAQTDIGGIITDIRFFTRSGVTDYPAAAAMGANNVFPDSFVTLLRTNPDTGQPWGLADLTTLEVGVESI